MARVGAQARTVASGSLGGRERGPFREAGRTCAFNERQRPKCGVRRSEFPKVNLLVWFRAALS